MVQENALIVALKHLRENASRYLSAYPDEGVKIDALIALLCRSNPQWTCIYKERCREQQTCNGRLCQNAKSPAPKGGSNE